MAAVTPVRASGGVLWRPAGAGPEVCLVHRARYDDWSLPKGKCRAGEHPLAAAVREVGEETGVRAVPQLRLPTVRYTLPGGAPKTVDFWSMTVSGDAPVDPGDEVDDVAWLPVPQAVDRVSYHDDARLLRHFAGRPTVTVALPLVRHAHAGKRDTYPGPDAARPLDDRGWREARALAPLLALAAPQRLLSAAPLRCVQTLDPLAGLVDLPIEVDSAFDEPGPGEEAAERAAGAAARLAELAAAGTPLVVCSQGKVLPHLLARLAGQGGPADYRTGKGTGWLLAFAGKDLAGADRIVPSDV